MTKFDRLRLVGRVAQRREREAARALAEHRRVFSTCQTRLHELETYRREYLRGLAESGRTGDTAGRIKNVHRFLSSLDETIAQAGTQTARAQERCVQKEREWMVFRNKSKALAKALDNARTRELHAKVRREQRRLDEQGRRDHCTDAGDHSQSGSLLSLGYKDSRRIETQ